jgi:Putative Ig domain
MRRSRRGGGSALEFGGSGEDSFVAVVVTKLTGALLFILLLTMVIMALLPKVDPEHAGRNTASAESGTTAGGQPLQIATPASLPDAVAGRPYVVALAATGGNGPARWHVDGSLPGGLALDETTGRIAGTPPNPTEQPLAFRISADDGTNVASQAIQLAVLPSLSPPNPGSWWKPRWPALAVAWRSWLEQGVGFLMLWLVHLLGMNLLTGLERHSHEQLLLAGDADTGQLSLHRRFGAYRILLRIATVSATVALAAWLALARGPGM